MLSISVEFFSQYVITKIFEKRLRDRYGLARPAIWRLSNYTLMKLQWTLKEYVHVI